MLCPKCNVDDRPIQSMNGRMQIVEACPRCEHEYSKVQPAPAAEVQQVVVSAPRHVQAPKPPITTTNVLQLAKERYAQCLAEEHRLIAVRAERKQLERMIKAAERSQRKESN